MEQQGGDGREQLRLDKAPGAGGHGCGRRRARADGGSPRKHGRHLIAHHACSRRGTAPARRTEVAIIHYGPRQVGGSVRSSSADASYFQTSPRSVDADPAYPGDAVHEVLRRNRDAATWSAALNARSTVARRLRLLRGRPSGGANERDFVETRRRFHRG